MNEATKPLPVAKPEAAPAQSTQPEPVRHPLALLRQEMDRLFDEFSTGFSAWPLGRRLFGDRSAWRPMEQQLNMPAVEVIESDQAWKITAELPGIDEKDIELTLSDDMLRIRGEKREEKEERRKDYSLSERRYGMFERSFTLPPNVDAEKIAAQCSKGVLTVTLPKRPGEQPRQPRRIEVQTK